MDFVLRSQKHPFVPIDKLFSPHAIGLGKDLRATPKKIGRGALLKAKHAVLHLTMALKKAVRMDVPNLATGFVHAAADQNVPMAVQRVFLGAHHDGDLISLQTGAKTFQAGTNAGSPASKSYGTFPSRKQAGFGLRATSSLPRKT